MVRCADTATAARWVGALVGTLPTVIRTHSLVTADRAWARAGGVFRPAGTVVRLPGTHTAGAREMYCRDVYLRSGLSMPHSGWVLDLGANSGLFAVWAACSGARAVAVEAQQDFADEVRSLAEANGVAGLVTVVTAMAAGDTPETPPTGILADDARWTASTHAVGDRPEPVSVGQIMEQHGIDRIGLMKVDIEGGEFSVLSPLGDLAWLDRVDQIALEVHPEFGNVTALVDVLRPHGFSVRLDNDEGVRLSGDAVNDAAYAYASRVAP